jgi:hypothetical protein
MFLPGYGPIVIADWSIICAMPSIGQTWILASIGAVVEMGVLSTLKRLLMESKGSKSIQWFLFNLEE